MRAQLGLPLVPQLQPQPQPQPQPSAPPSISSSSTSSPEYDPTTSTVHNATSAAAPLCPAAHPLFCDATPVAPPSHHTMLCLQRASAVPGIDTDGVLHAAGRLELACAGPQDSQGGLLCGSNVLRPEYLMPRIPRAIAGQAVHRFRSTAEGGTMSGRLLADPRMLLFRQGYLVHPIYIGIMLSIPLFLFIFRVHDYSIT